MPEPLKTSFLWAMKTNLDRGVSWRTLLHWTRRAVVCRRLWLA